MPITARRINATALVRLFFCLTSRCHSAPITKEMTMEYIVNGFVNNSKDFQVLFDNEDDARKEFETRKDTSVEVYFYHMPQENKFVEIDSFFKPLNEG